jgi:hypothetical protein
MAVSLAISLLIGKLRDRFAPVLGGGRGIQQRARCRHPRRHVGQLELDRLELLDRLAELSTLGGIIGRHLERGPGDAHGLSGNPQPAMFE